MFDFEARMSSCTYASVCACLVSCRAHLLSCSAYLFQLVVGHSGLEHWLFSIVEWSFTAFEGACFGHLPLVRLLRLQYVCCRSTFPVIIDYFSGQPLLLLSRLNLIHRKCLFIILQEHRYIRRLNFILRLLTIVTGILHVWALTILFKMHTCSHINLLLPVLHQPFLLLVLAESSWRELRRLNHLVCWVTSRWD